jgi:hypothetical protein
VVWMDIITDQGCSVGDEFNISALFYKIFRQPRAMVLELITLYIEISFDRFRISESGAHPNV